MKKVVYILFLFLGIACYDDDSQVVQSDSTLHRSSDLSLFIQSISSHYASFDDKIDHTPCFSIAFPYEIYVNSNLVAITSVQDIENLDEESNVEIVYPISTHFYNYEEHQANNQTEFNLLKNSCNADFEIAPNDCLDFEFPISLKEYNNLTESFETFHLNTNQEVFVHVQNLHENDVYEIDYPIFLKNYDESSIRINSNAEFINAFYLSLQHCSN